MTGDGGFEIRPARPEETGAVAAVLAGAFEHDPVWGDWAFPDPHGRLERSLPFWEFPARSALRFDGVATAPDLAAVALWIPPGVPELTLDEEPAFAEMLEQVLGPRAALVAAAFGVLGAERPHGVPHHYLSLLATDPGRRGGGVGMRLLAGTLDAVDAAGLPAYLESTNPANVDRYRSVGFERYGSFDLPEGPTVTTMWRPARTGAA